jgi:hypothetical protein
MKIIIGILSAFLVGIAGMGLTVDAAAEEGVLFKQRLENTSYCHLKFPAIRRDTLFTNRPQLQDPRFGRIIDYYGSCNHDPLGPEEIVTQRENVQREERRAQD